MAEHSTQLEEDIQVYDSRGKGTPFMEYMEQYSTIHDDDETETLPKLVDDRSSVYTERE
jgi:hypothetical protein